MFSYSSTLHTLFIHETHSLCGLANPEQRKHNNIYSLLIIETFAPES